MDDEVKKQRIGWLTAAFMGGLAFLFDLIQVPLTITVILPILVGFLAALIFVIWFKVLGVHYFQGKRAVLKVLALGAPILVSVIPLINDIPDITAGVLFTIALATLEDKEVLPTKDPKQVAVEQRAVRQKQVLARQAALRQQQQAAAAALPPEEEAA